MAEPSHVLDAHEKYGLPFTYTRNGKTLVTGGFNGAIKVWSMNDWRETNRLIGHDQSVNCGCITGAGILVTGSTDTTLRVWDLTEEDAVATLKGHKKTVASISAHPKRPLVASASYDTTVRLWDLDEEDEVLRLEGHEKNVTSVRFLPDGRHLVSAGLGADLVVWDSESGEEVHRLPAHETAVAGLARSPDGDLWTAGHDGRVSCWSPRDWAEKVAFALPKQAVPTGIACNPVTGHLAITKDHGVLIMGTEGNLLDTHDIKIKGVYAPRWAPDGRHLAVGGADGKVRIYG